MVNRLRGCSKYNRDAAPRWRFQVDSRILFDDLEYDPQRWPIGPQPWGKYGGGLYSIEDPDKTKLKRIADDICNLTDRLVAERQIIRAAFALRIKERYKEDDSRRSLQLKKERATKHEQLPSGKTILRRFNRSGSLIEEHHIYGNLDIGIKCFFKAGVKTDEMYFSKGCLVSKQVYEKARSGYKDMPPANQTLEDWGGELLRAAR